MEILKSLLPSVCRAFHSGLPIIVFTLSSGMLFSQDFTIDQGERIVTCEGFFFDSGGRDSSYGANESHSITFCSDQASGSHIQLVFSAPDLDPGDQLCFYDGEDDSAPQLSCARDFLLGSPFIIQATAANSSGCLTITFESDGSRQGKGWAANINCIPACQNIQAELIETSPEIVPVDTGYIDTCPGQRISLKAQGVYPQNGVAYQHSDSSARFEWNFGDGTLAVGPEVSHEYRNPGGYTVQLVIRDQFGCRSTNFINQRVRVSTRPNFQTAGDIPPQICAKDTLALNAVVNRLDNSKSVSAVSTEGSFQFGGIRSDSLPLPDGTGTAYQTSIEFSDFLPGQTLTDVDELLGICLNIEHSWMRDLEISIQCPDGRDVLLHDHRGQVGGSVFLGIPDDNDNFSIRPGEGFDYCWTPDATRPNWLDYANENTPRTLPEGDYQSVETLEELVGCPLNGEWTMRVEDLWGQDNGFIFSWGINFDPALFPNLETFTPEIIDFGWEEAPYVFFESKDSLAAAPKNAGQACYTFETLNNYGCNFDTVVCVQVLPVTHPDCYDCQSELTATPDTAICEGEQVFFDVSVESNLDTNLVFEIFPDYTIGASNHPPEDPYVSTLDISSVQSGSITDAESQVLSVCVEMETDWTGDIDLILRAPNGQELLLSGGNGGEGDNFSGTCFTPSATVPISAGTAPFNGSFQPDGDWSVLNGAPLNGEWSLVVSDAAGPNEQGRLLQWSITFVSTNEITYSWAPSAGLSCTDCSNPVAMPSSTTDYIVTASDLYGCIETDTTIVAIASDDTPPDVTCTVSDEDQEITFSWSPTGDRFEHQLLRNGAPEGWVPQPTGNTVTFSNLERRDELTLQLRYYLGNTPENCSFEISEATCTYMPCDLEAQLLEGPSPLDCYGDSNATVSIGATGGDAPYTYSLDDSNDTQETGSFSGLSSGEHFVVVRDTGICVDTVRFAVTQPDSLTADMTQVSQGCPGARDNQATVTATGGNGGFNFQWSDGQTTSTAVNLDSLNYGVTVTDARGCSASDTLTMEDLPSFNPNVIQSSPTCFGDSDGQLAVNFVEGGLSQDPTDYRFQWSTGDTTRVVENLTGGLSYRITVTSQQNCVVEVERVLRQPSQITFDLQTNDIICSADQSGSVSVVNVQGDNDNFSYQWSPNTRNQIGPKANNLSPGSYTVTVTDEEGCFNTGSITLQAPDEINLDIVKTNNACFGSQEGRIRVSLSGGTAPYQLQWSNGATGSTLEQLPAGDYTLSITDDKGCQKEQVISIEEPPLLTVNVLPGAPTCFGQRNGSISLEVQGGTPPYLFSLDNQTFNGSNIFLGLGAGEYTVYVKDGQGCVFLDRITLEDPPRFSVYAGPDQSIILGDSIQLMASSENGEGGVTYLWNAPYEGTLNCTECSDPLSTTVNTITYELYGIDGRGCESNDFINIMVEKPRVVEVPTGFTPNQDGQNDILLVHGQPGTLVRLFRVYDRWGELLYEMRDFEVNDPNTGWDGTFRGQDMNGGVFVWYVEIEYIDGVTDFFHGHTTLIR